MCRAEPFEVPGLDLRQRLAVQPQRGPVCVRPEALAHEMGVHIVETGETHYWRTTALAHWRTGGAVTQGLSHVELLECYQPHGLGKPDQATPGSTRRRSRLVAKPRREIREHPWARKTSTLARPVSVRGRAGSPPTEMPTPSRTRRLTDAVSDRGSTSTQPRIPRSGDQLRPRTSTGLGQ